MRSRIALLGALCACVVLVGGAGAAGGGSVALTTIGVASAQSFDTLAITGTANTALPTGWYLAESGTSARNNDAYAASTGSDNAGDVYSFGGSGSTERASGTLLSGTLTPIIGAQFTNNTGASIAQLSISYIGEQWRLGASARGADRLDFQISTDATSLTTGTWTDVDALDFSSPITVGTVGLLDGNAAANRSSVASTVPFSVAQGASFWIRWTDFNVTNADDGLAVDDFSLTPIAEDLPPSVQATSPTSGMTNVAVGSNLTVTFDEPVNATVSSFDISCANSGSHTAAVSGGPTTYTVDPDTDFAFSELCTVTVLAANVTDQDANDPPDNMAANYVFSFATAEAFFCGDPATPIHTVQGSGAASSIVGSSVQVEGIVVGDFQAAGQFGGYFLQEEDAQADADPATSEGIFVFNTLFPVSVGEVVRVRGSVAEFNGLTELTSVNAVSVCSSGNALPAVTEATLPSDLEPYEGMRVRLPQSLVISEYFNYDRFGELVLALPLAGESRPFTPTSIDEPGPSALARLTANLARRITLDDGLSIQNPSTLRHPNGDPFSLSNRFRGGDAVQNTVGVMDFQFGLYRIQPTGPADYTATNPRPAAPEPVGGTLRVAAMNTLNFFVTADYPSGNPLDNKCGPLQNVECRGWDFDQPDEFTRQRDKLLQALIGLNADVLGLNELENTTGVDPLSGPSGVVPGLNAILGPGTYASIDTGTIGPDAIKVGLIYKPAEVTPVGAYKLLTSAVDPRFIDTKSRPVLAQTFEENATGARFTVAVNHLKSKGSDCLDLTPPDPDAGDGQGNCNGTRTAAAQALVDWLASDPTGSGDPDFLIVGDLNSYAQEDPIDAIKAGPDDTAGTSDDYTNLVHQFVGTYAYSYVFDGMAGYLDHALSSAGLTAQVTGLTEWHINADEPDVLDYDTSFKPPAQDALYEPNAFRTSDHDPILVGLDPATTFGDLCRLTQTYVTKAGVADALCAKLAAASAADARDNAEAKAGALKAYVNQVRAQTGKSLTAAQAETLIALAGQL